MAAPVGQDLGTRLRLAREARGLSLRRVADATKISVRALEAIERNDHSQLPGGIFGRAFVRAYAAEVGLDPEAALAEFLTRVPGDALAVPGPEPSTIDAARWPGWRDRRVIGLAAVVLIALAAIGGGAYWVYTAGAGSRTADYGLAGQTASPARPAAAAPGLRRAVRVPPAVPAVTAGGEPVRAAATNPSALRLVLHPTAPCWVSTIVDGGASVSRLIRPGEELVIEAHREVVLKVGDAGALSFTINGRRARPLGAAGEVVTARVSAATLADLLAAP